MSEFVDLHTHTTASDGTLSPKELVKLAKESRFTAIAVTDHDTVLGLEEAQVAGRRYDLEIVNGIEFSTLFGPLELHILGYYIEPKNRQLQEIIVRLVDARKTRALKMVQKLKILGLDITWYEVTTVAQGEVIGRPHIAKVMQNKGYIKAIEEAFSLAYIAKGGRAYAERYKLTPQRAIDIIHSAGGVAVLAHPGLVHRGEGFKAKEMKSLIERGLDGLEVYHSAHTSEHIEYYEQVAVENKLLLTGGSDFHGANKDEGSELGTVALDYQYLAKIKEAVQKS